jgi:hypothetical protein
LSPYFSDEVIDEKYGAAKNNEKIVIIILFPMLGSLTMMLLATMALKVEVLTLMVECNRRR